jgi:hypothetical protein
VDCGQGGKKKPTGLGLLRKSPIFVLADRHCFGLGHIPNNQAESLAFVQVL